MKITRFQVRILKLILNALKLPIIICVLGLVLSNLNLIQPLYTKWKNIIDVTGEMGSALIDLSFILFFYLLATSVLKIYERSLSASQHKTTSHILSVIRKGLGIVFVFIAIYTTITVFELKHQSLDFAQKIVAVFFIGSIAWILLQILSTLEVFFYHQYSSLEKGLDYRRITSSYTKIHQIRNIAVVIIVTIAIAAALMVFDSVRNIGISILASAGFLTAIIGLAAQKTLGSMFAGIQLAFSQPFGIGDSVMVENELGTVEELTLSYVVIKTSDLRRLIFPINYFIEKYFTNLSRDENGIVGLIKLYVDYVLPIEPVRKELYRILAESSLWNKKVGSLAVSKFQENTVELIAKLSSNNLDDLGDLSNEVREKLLEFIRQHYPEGFPRFRVNS